MILTRAEKKQLVKLSLLDIITSILDIIFLVGLLYVINFYTQANHTMPSFFFPALFDKNPLLLISIFFMLFAIKNLIGFLVSKMQYNYVYNVAARISKDNLLHYLNSSYEEYVQVDSSVNMYRISQQPIEFCHYVLSGIQQVFSQVILILLTVIAILSYNPFLFPLLLIILIPPVFLIAWFIKKKLAATRLQGKVNSEKAIQHLQEALAGFVESNIHGKHDFFSNRYQGFQSRLNHYLAEKLVVQNMPSRLIEVFAVFGLFMLVVLNTLTVGAHSMQFITLGAFMAAAYKIIPGIVKIMNISGQVKSYMYTVTGLLEVKHHPSKNATDDPVHSISFENISFSYPGKKILDSFSMHISKGDFVGIAGFSGKGKTTLANLLLGFLEQESGNIHINGKQCNREERQQYWNRISYIKQQPFFLHDTIIQNITLQEADHNSGKIDQVVATTGINELLANTGMSLNTLITENGKNFSGGQRQRIIFARALYKDFDLIILDEPFNELDEASEIKMLEQLKVLSNEGKIVILITHNKMALSFCNKKIELDAAAA